jgi:hypothetical protein
MDFPVFSDDDDKNKFKIQTGMVVHAFNPSTQESEAGKF